LREHRRVRSRPAHGAHDRSGRPARGGFAMIALKGRRGCLRLWTAIGLLFAVGSAPAIANDVPALLVEKRCNACHDTNAMLIGPAYVAIAARHRENKRTMVEGDRKSTRGRASRVKN